MASSSLDNPTGFIYKGQITKVWGGWRGTKGIEEKPLPGQSDEQGDCRGQESRGKPHTFLTLQSPVAVSPWLTPSVNQREGSPLVSPHGSASWDQDRLEKKWRMDLRGQTEYIWDSMAH